MSRLQRAVAKAEREGLLTWTGRGDTDRPAPSPTPRAAVSVPATRAFPIEDEWHPEIGSMPTAVDNAGSLSPLFVAATLPLSAAGEQYRLLRTRLEGRDRGRRTQLVLVTSPGPGDGKTTTSANLAFTMGQDLHHTVVLVEADLRRPTLAALCGLATDRGLADVLIGAAELDDVLVHLPGQNLYVLPAGQVTAGSTELLGSSLMTRLLDGLRARFDRIVIDSPPVTLADTHVLARLADGVLVVVRAGVTSRPALEHTLEGIERDRVLGLVLNDVDLAAGSYVGAYAWNTGA